MAKFGKATLKALRWIKKVAGFFAKSNAARIAAEVVIGRIFGAKARKYLDELRELEETVGAHTSVWKKVSSVVSKSESEYEESPITLSYNEAQYLGLFKRLWDRYVKRALRKAKSIG